MKRRAWQQTAFPCLSRGATLVVLTVAWLSFGVASARAQGADSQAFGTLTSLPVPDGEQVFDFAQADFDGDGALDVLVSTAASDPSGGGARHLHLHLRQETDPPFRSLPDHTIDLTPDVIAFAIADVVPATGKEVLLLNGRGVFASIRATDGETGDSARVLKIGEQDFLWQRPDPAGAFSWQRGIVDLDADGDDDLWLPQTRGYRAWLREPEGFRASPLLQFPPGSTPLAHWEESPIGKMVDTGSRWGSALGQFGYRDPLYSWSGRLPSPRLVDWDRDGDLDFLAQSVDSLCVWSQTEGAFAALPDQVMGSPVRVDFRRRLDVSFYAMVRDIDRDRLPDLLFVARNVDSEDIRSQILLYPQEAGKPLTANSLPRQLLLVAGFVGSPQLTDVNGDGELDLAFTVFRPDVLDQVRSLATQSIALEFLVYLGTRTGFSSKPDAQESFSMRFENRSRVQEGTARLIGDVTGDGVQDILLRDRVDHLEIRMSRQRGDRLGFVPTPVWELDLEEPARVVVDESTDPPELFVTQPGRLLHVRF